MADFVYLLILILVSILMGNNGYSVPKRIPEGVDILSNVKVGKDVI